MHTLIHRDMSRADVVQLGCLRIIWKELWYYLIMRCTAAYFLLQIERINVYCFTLFEVPETVHASS